MLTDRNISESDPLVKVATTSSSLIFQTLQYMLRNNIIKKRQTYLSHMQHQAPVAFWYIAQSSDGML